MIAGGKSHGRPEPRVCGLGLASGFGMGAAAHLTGVREGRSVLKPLRELWGAGHPWGDVLSGWIPDRKLLCSRRNGPASQLALLLARQAVEEAGWGEEELKDAALIVGSSRGNASGWLSPWPGRRSMKILAVPNSLHSELASCVSIELGIRGPYHVLASGCAAGLDAVGMAAMLMRQGIVRRALAIGLETALSWNVVNIELVGTRASPAVIITQREKAVVLFRGGSTTRRAVESQLEKRGVKTVELLVDLRMQPEEPCRIEAQKRINAAALAENITHRASCGGVDLELFRPRQGCILRMRVGGQRFITLSGTVRPAKPIRAEWLLASMARPENIRYTDCLTLSSKYRWMERDAEPVSRLRLRLEG